MPDVWSAVQDQDSTVQDRLADVLETRGADPIQQAMRREFLERISFPPDANVLEVGCGTGVLCRSLASWPGVRAVVGIDPAPSLIDRAKQLAASVANLEFTVGDGRDMPFNDGTFDVVIFDSTLCHVPGPDAALAEAWRVLGGEGILAAFDGDYATATVSLGPHDPLQACVDATMHSSVNDRFLVRRLPSLVQAAGFALESIQGHSYVESGTGGYMLTVIDRGADMLAAQGQIAVATAAQLKAEARERVAAGTFFGHIAYGSVIGRKPGAL